MNAPDGSAAAPEAKDEAADRRASPGAPGTVPLSAGARGFVRAGFLFGAFAILTAVLRGSVQGYDTIEDLLWAATFGFPALVLAFLTGRLGTFLLLRSRLPAEIESGNLAAGLVAGAHYAAAGLIAAHCFYGHDLSTLTTGAIFFVIAQATLLFLLWLFRLLTAYADHEEILGHNMAAAVSYAGVDLALAMVVAHAADGAFAGWLPSLRAYVIALALALSFYPVRQLLVQGLMLRCRPTFRGGELDRRIARDHDVGFAAVEAAAYVATALLVTGLG